MIITMLASKMTDFASTGSWPRGYRNRSLSLSRGVQVWLTLRAKLCGRGPRAEADAACLLPI